MFNESKSLRVRVTNKCNAKCHFCHGENGLIHAPYEFLSIQALEYVLCHFDKKINSIALSGGEPLLHPQIVQIAQMCVNKVKDRVHINTNGLLMINKYIDGIVNAGVKNFHINLNTLNQKSYRIDYGVNFPKHLLNGLNILQTLGVNITINYVFTTNRKKNDILHMIEFCQSKNLSLSIIDEHKKNPLYKGLMFQRRMYDLLTKNGFFINSVYPGRINYKNGVNNICIASPCSPALAWNGHAKDDAIVLHENGNVTGFIYDDPQLEF